MNTHAVIETYVLDVIRRVPGKDRDEVGFELRGLLTEMLADRAERAGRAADDAMVLQMLREFGAPAEIAARYSPPSGLVIIPAEQTRQFALLALAGLALQWALTLPAVFQGQTPIVQWWFTWGLGSLWWPGFMVTMSLIAAWAGQLRTFKAPWTPRKVDSDRINRRAYAFGLAWIAIGVVFMTALPWIAGTLPEPLASVFAFDPAFLRERAPWVLPLWLAGFATQAAMLKQGRRSPALRRIELAGNVAFIALLGWWLTAGDMFVAKATNDGARGGIALVIAILVIDLLQQLYRQRTRIRTPRAVA